LVSGLVFLPVYPLTGVALLLLLPAGWPDDASSRRLLVATAGLTAVAGIGYAVTPGRLDTEPLTNPLGLASVPWLGRSMLIGAWLGLAGCALAAVWRLASRWRQGRGEERHGMAYLAVGGILTLAQFGLALVLGSLHVHVPPPVRDVASVLVIATLPICVGLAILHTRLLDIELVLRRSLTYLLMTIAVVAVYAVTVVVVGEQTSQRSQLGTTLLITGAAAVGLSPLRERAQRQVDRLLYGRRGDPYGVLRDLDTAIGEARTPAGVLDAITATVADALKLPYVAVEIEGRRAGHGTPRAAACTVELSHHGRPAGTLVLAPRSPGEEFSAMDDRLLREIGEHVASAVAAVALAEEAQRSRERLVHALEDDRRRIRRDLHDHLGPVLSGIMLQLDALRRLTAGDDKAHALADTVRGEVADAVVDVRRLVHDLRPPVLDELGLAESLRQYAVRLAESLAVTVDIPPLPRLPAAVEVAAYRIATEALTNALRHADASHVDLALEVHGERLHLTVTDDGRGVAEGAPAGLGLRSMRERAAELGGRFAVHGLTPGTCIDVELPL
jgi:signal transduction histidine kinase